MSDVYNNLEPLNTSMLGRNESILGYDPKFIAKHVLTLQTITNNNNDVFKLIRIGIERGNNLEKILRTSKPEFVIELKKLIELYNLVSNVNNSKYALTLSSICNSFPKITCSYIKCAIHTVVSVGKMQLISKNYPTVMMTSAFAFFIPNKNETFCLLLKKAHMLHQFEFFSTVSGIRMYTSSNQRNVNLISNTLKQIDAAINETHMTYKMQINFLKENHLITLNNNKITVSEEVLEAVKVWDKKMKAMRRYFINAKIHDLIL